ncbi:MAG TPA: hypothetical protein VMB74_09995 [Streptosporangiaceae bacterium]|nr:hypothetical protein [Streptosporangiaceae bacterium]
MIRVRHLTLPPGLSAVVRKDIDGRLQVFVSDALAPDRQRAAVRLALRSIRGSGWRTGLLTVPIGVLLGTFGRRLAPISRALRTHVVATAATAVVAAAVAAALIVALPQHRGPTAAGPQPGLGQAPAVSPGPAHIAASSGPGHGALPAPGGTGAASTSPAPRPGPVTVAHSAPSASQSSAPEPGTSTGVPQPGTPSPTATAAPSPSASPAAPAGVTCLVVLSVWVCL